MQLHQLYIIVATLYTTSVTTAKISNMLLDLKLNIKVSKQNFFDLKLLGVAPRRVFCLKILRFIVLDYGY